MQVTPSGFRHESVQQTYRVPNFINERKQRKKPTKSLTHELRAQNYFELPRVDLHGFRPYVITTTKKQKIHIISPPPRTAIAGLIETKLGRVNVPSNVITYAKVEVTWLTFIKMANVVCNVVETVFLHSDLTLFGGMI